MKTKIAVWYLAALNIVFSPTPAPAQGLINGGFELYDPATKFLPGWHAKLVTRDYGTVMNGVSGSLLEYNYHPGEVGFASIYGPIPEWDALPIGKYWFFGSAAAVTLEQRFVVPKDSQSLQYRAFRGRLEGISVYINGTHFAPLLKAVVKPGSLSSGSEISDYWLDIGAYAGQEVDLTISIDNLAAGFDDVRVSTEVVPEPGIFALGVVGLSLVFLAGHKKTHGSSTAARRIPGMPQFVP